MIALKCVYRQYLYLCMCFCARAQVLGDKGVSFATKGNFHGATKILELIPIQIGDYTTDILQGEQKWNQI